MAVRLPILRSKGAHAQIRTCAAVCYACGQPLKVGGVTPPLHVRSADVGVDSSIDRASFRANALQMRQDGGWRCCLKCDGPMTKRVLVRAYLLMHMSSDAWRVLGNAVLFASTRDAAGSVC